MDISIIIPYNEDRGYLKDAIKSCTEQEFTGTFEVIPWFGNYSVSKNINDAVKIAKGDYIKFCAEDDMLLPGCLQILFDKAIELNCDFVCANAINKYVYSDYEEISKSKIPKSVAELAQNNTIHGLTILYKKISLPEFNEKLNCGEEFEISLKMAESSYKFGYIDCIVGIYRIGYHAKSFKRHRQSKESKDERQIYIYDKIKFNFINSKKLINKC